MAKQQNRKRSTKYTWDFIEKKRPGTHGYWISISEELR